MNPSFQSRAGVRGNLDRIVTGIAEACEIVGRDPASVRLVAASKTVSIERVRWAHEAGVSDFGENYLTELREKAPELPDATWHYIGALQSSTAHKVADLADVVETVSSERATGRLARRAVSRERTITALIEVDFTYRRTGVRPEDVPAVADRVASLKGLRLAGLMTLPPIPRHAEDSRPYFVRMRKLLDSLVGAHPGMAELSMGMSMDYRTAVEEGATMVRIGTALFGERPPRS